MGIPTAPIVTSAFDKVVKKSVSDKGMPLVRFTFVEHPVSSQPAEVCQKKIAGNDPVTGIPVLDEITDALAKPLTAEETKTGFMDPVPVPRLLEPDTQENLERLFLENGWTDYLPIILPTEERVAEMLKGTSHAPDELVGSMQPSSPHVAWSYTVEKIAVAAVMAGCKPEYLPVLLAIGESGQTSLFTSTCSWARLVVVNGPIAEEIGMSAGIGAMSPFNHANATIGRAWTLISKNLGNGGVPGTNYMGTLGNPLNYSNVCIPEKESRLPEGWNPLHVQKGFQPEESAVSIFTGLSVADGAGGYGAGVDRLASELRNTTMTGPGMTPNAAIFMDPLLAHNLKNQYGIDSKETLISQIKEKSKLQVSEYWNLYPKDREEGLKGVEPYASWLKLNPYDEVPVRKFVQEKPYQKDGATRDPSLEIIVFGGETNSFHKFGDWRYIMSASVDKWR